MLVEGKLPIQLGSVIWETHLLNKNAKQEQNGLTSKSFTKNFIRKDLGYLRVFPAVKELLSGPHNA